jgi:hypothetical protein
VAASTPRAWHARLARHARCTHPPPPPVPPPRAPCRTKQRTVAGLLWRGPGQALWVDRQRHEAQPVRKHLVLRCAGGGAGLAGVCVCV